VHLVGDDHRLVQRLRAGDESAYVSLQDSYNARLIALAMARGCSRAVAEEVVQETWTAVARGVHGFQGRSSLKSWIFRIHVNATHAQVKRERRLVAVETTESFATAATPYDRVLWNELLSLIRGAIESLPPSQRRVIVLRDVQGWSAEETCEHLDLSEANQRVLLHRARTHVRAALDVYLDGDGLPVAA
jgi:RNA polymerase sigma-70 factor (ECF subfamily)